MPADPPEDSGPGNAVGPASAPKWVQVVGVVSLAVATLFFMGLVIAGIGGHPVPCDTKIYARIVLAILLAVGSGFLGGWAKAEGKIPSLGALVGLVPKNGDPGSGSPITFGIGGGGAVFIIVLLLAAWVDQCPGENKYILEILKPPRVDIPPAPANKDWLVTVDFRVDPIPPSNFSLTAEFSERPDFKTLIASAMSIKNPESGQAVDQIPTPPGKLAWLRLILRNTSGREVAASKISQVKE